MRTVVFVLTVEDETKDYQLDDVIAAILVQPEDLIGAEIKVLMEVTDGQ